MPETDRRQCLTLVIVDDGIAELTETVELLLSDSSGSGAVQPNQATVQITDDGAFIMDSYLVCKN